MIMRPANVVNKSVLCLTHCMILARDLEQAIYNVGLLPVLEATPGTLHAAVIADTDKLDRKKLALVRWHRQAHVPIIVIADTEKRAKQVGGPAGLKFTKPLCSNDVAFCARTLLESAANNRASGILNHD